MMQITEDTPPDMLAGAMDLTVHLPTGRVVKMAVERSTPMMDLLVQITTAHHLQHSGHILQALAMAPTSGHTDKILPYKPNTPIGVLDIQHVKVVAKNRSISASRNSTTGHQPFESTFRLQVHLPRNQLYVIRVSQNVYLGDIMRKVCDEKKLDIMKYEFRHPGNLDETLDPKFTLSDYQITEVYLVAKGTIGLSQAFSSNDIMALRKEEERKQLQARTGGGVFSLIFKRGKTSMGTGSISSENRSISPSHSDDSRSITPPAIQQQILPISQEHVEKPKPPQRKRRVAPKPPQQAEERKNPDKPTSQISNSSDVSETDCHKKKSDNGLTICHSRNSSDSSGYHEPSVLSDHCNTSLPRKPKGIKNQVVTEEIICENKSNKVNGNLSNMATFSKSTASIAGRKKKAPPPPPLVVSKAESVVPVLEKTSPVVDASITQSAENRGSVSTIDSNKKPARKSLVISQEPDNSAYINKESTKQTAQEIVVPNNSETNSRSADKQPEYPSQPEISNIYRLEGKQISNNVNISSNSTLSFNSESAISYNNHSYDSPPPMNFSNIPNIPIEPIETDLERHQSINKIIEDINDIEWEYQIPPPPSEFRDKSPVKNHIEVEERNLINENNEECKKTKSVVTESDRIITDDTPPMLNTLTLENLEKRKSLVYNREISASLKVAQENSNNSIDSKDIISKRSSMLNELEEVIQNGGSRSLTRHTENHVIDTSLPNFKISTYAEPKTKFNIFEDDSIRSKSEENNTDDAVFKRPHEFNKCKTSSRNNFYVKHQNPKTILRSESFSSNMANWKPLNPVQRSKSQIALNKSNDQENKAEDSNLTKSNSLFDVSGLQSLEVMRVIQNKLNTPNSSSENLLKENTKTDNISENVHPTKEGISITTAPKTTQMESTTNTKTYQYQGPPAINLSTWSERPKTKVSLKEDTDYKISTKNSRTSIKINGTESTVTQEPGSLIIKVEETKPNNNYSSKYINHTSVVNFRKPLGNVNKIENVTRPHSVAYESDFEISRVPIVRAVELKKSVTQIINDNNKYSGLYRSSEAVNGTLNPNKNFDSRRVQRVNSFGQNHINVLGFRNIDFGNDNTARSRKSWNVPNSYSTLPSKINLTETTDKSSTYTTNSNVPFSQVRLKRVESRTADDVGQRNTIPQSNNRFSAGSQFMLKNNSCEVKQPLPPPMPRIAHTTKKTVTCNGNSGDTRDELLNSIRNFGGLKGLRHVKV